MMRRVAIGLLALTAPSLLGAAQTEPASVTVGTGCWFDIVLTVDQIGRVCHAGQNAEFAGALAGDIARIEAMYRQRGVSAADIASIKLKAIQMSPASDAQTCNGYGNQFYQSMAKAGPAELHTTTDAVVARHGLPTYGDCF